MGSFCVYGSLLDNILDCYGFTNDDVSYLAAIMIVTGVLSAGLLGAYIEKTLNYRRVFVALGVLGIVQSCFLPIFLRVFGDNFGLAAVLIGIQGIVFIPLMPLSFDYGCDILYPAGEAQITGCLMTSGQIIGIIFQAFLRILGFVTELADLVEDILVHRDVVLTDEDAGHWRVVVQFVIFVLADLFEAEPFVAGGEQSLEDFTGEGGELAGQFVGEGEDLLVEERGVGVLEGQGPADHRIEDDSAAPEVGVSDEFKYVYLPAYTFNIRYVYYLLLL
ncbi:unnamed protein product [Sphagnum balticum]